MDHATTLPTEGIPLDVVQHTLWHFGDHGLGVQPGRFGQRLMLLIASADADNRRILADSYPAYSLAFDIIANRPGGLNAMRDRAKAGERTLVLPTAPGTVIAIGAWWFVRLRPYQDAPSAWEMLPLPSMQLKVQANANGFEDQCVYGDDTVLAEAEQEGAFVVIAAPCAEVAS